MILAKKIIEKTYLFLFPDAGPEGAESFRYKLFVVLVALFMFSTAACTMVFIQA
jgi:hypothetical protein